MFDTTICSASDAEVIAAIEDGARAEARAAAGRLAAIAELVRRRCGDGDERAHWACDAWDAAGAEVSAALGVMPGRASGQMHLSQALDRLPQVAALFIEGRIGYRVFAAIAWRTDLVQDSAALALIDGAVAANVVTWRPLSDYRLEQAIDIWVDRYDPAALRRARSAAQSRDVRIGSRDDEAGTTALFGRLYSTDAELLDRRLRQMAHGVCEDDPRTGAQRRADALGALAAGADRLACACGSPRCPAAVADGRGASVVVHVLADSATGSRAGILGRRGVVPSGRLAELVESGAKVLEVRRPSREPEPGYRPSSALAAFVRFRDMTCRFPNCDQPAEHCDIDHTEPWPAGPTHPSNLKCVCRKHHLLKTFWDGPGGWADRQLPDGTVVWTAPSGQEYATVPGARLFFPAWDPTTAPLPPAVGRERPSERGVMMPTRKRSRAVDRALRVRCERSRNDWLIAERNRPPPF